MPIIRLNIKHSDRAETINIKTDENITKEHQTKLQSDLQKLIEKLEVTVPPEGPHGHSGDKVTFMIGDEPVIPEAYDSEGYAERLLEGLKKIERGHGHGDETNPFMIGNERVISKEFDSKGYAERSSGGLKKIEEAKIDPTINEYDKPVTDILTDNPVQSNSDTKTADGNDERINDAIRKITMFQIENAKNAEPFYHLIQDVIEKTKSIRANRSKTWIDTLQKATFQRDKKATLGVKASFSIADSVTNVSDEKLVFALESIVKFMEDGPNEMTSKRLDGIKKFADSLPSSAYKDSIDTIYRASLFVALAASSLAFPPLIPFTAPVMGGLSVSLGIGYVVMGLACHIGLKGFLDHTSEEMFETERFNVIRIIKDLEDNDDLPPDEGVPVKERIRNEVNTLLRDILEAKKNDEISASEAAKGLKIVHKALQGDEKALEDLDNLHEKMKFSYYNDSGHFLKSAAELAYKKYPVFASVVAIGAILNAGTVLIPPLFIQLCNSMLVGAAAVIAYESPNIVSATKVAVSELPSTIHATAIAVSELPSTIYTNAAASYENLPDTIADAAVAVYDLPTTIYTAVKNLPSSMRKPRSTEKIPHIDISDDEKNNKLIKKLTNAKEVISQLRAGSKTEKGNTMEVKNGNKPRV